MARFNQTCAEKVILLKNVFPHSTLNKEASNLTPSSLNNDTLNKEARYYRDLTPSSLNNDTLTVDWWEMVSSTHTVLMHVNVE